MSNKPNNARHSCRRRSWPHPLALGISAVTLALPSSAQALVVTTADVSFSNAASVSDSEGGGSSHNNGASLGSSPISQFDPSVGVLTGATLNLTSNRAQSVWVTATAGGGNGNNNAETSSGTGSSTAKITAPGLAATFGSISASDSCAGNRQQACTGSATTSAVAATNLLSAAANIADLDSYVGGGTVAVMRAAPSLTATQSDNKFSGTESTLYSVAWAGTLSATYSYLLHAAPAFGDGLTLTLDFGPLLVGDTANLNFDLWNLDGDRVGLDLDSIVGSGDTSAFSTDLATFSGLLAGEFLDFSAALDTTTVGKFSAHYLLSLSDADVGAAASRAAYSMDLYLTGEVLAPELAGVTGGPAVATIPEPTSMALVGVGMFGLGWLRRRRA